MTEYEVSMLKIAIGELIGTTTDNALSTLSILITLVSGYLVAIFLADSRLSRVQLSIATALYSLGYALLSLALMNYTELFQFLATKLGELERSPLHNASNTLQGYFILATLVCVYVATIWFMLSIRSRTTSTAKH